MLDGLSDEKAAAHAAAALQQQQPTLAQVGKVLAGIRVPESDRDAYQQMLDGLGYKFFDETDNVLYKDFMC